MSSDTTMLLRVRVLGTPQLFVNDSVIPCVDLAEMEGVYNMLRAMGKQVIAERFDGVWLWVSRDEMAQRIVDPERGPAISSVVERSTRNKHNLSIWS